MKKWLEFLANFGCLGEVALGPLCLFFPEYGFPITCIFHGYILSMTPFASVMEWNVFCIYMSYSMFGNVGISSGYTGYTLSSVVSSYLGLPLYLLLFLTFVLLMVPIYGQIYPKRVPFLVAFRPYAGNWRFSWHIVAKSAQNKMRKLKTLEVRNKNKKKSKCQNFKILEKKHFLTHFTIFYYYLFVICIVVCSQYLLKKVLNFCGVEILIFVHNLPITLAETWFFFRISVH